RTSWYFQRYAPHLPAAQEMVLLNRSWYNRAGVERVMGFCSDAEYQEFMETVPAFEQMLVRSGIRLFKYYLDISHDEQRKRLGQRRKDPLTQWKLSPIDDAAQKHWKEYSTARNEMFARTHTQTAPWSVVRANSKRLARLNLIRDLLTHLDYADKDHDLIRPDPDVVFRYADSLLDSGMISP
ncbi:MAG TPA: polyphosphate kinase 2, partial [Gammaproteobacteria bacterium]|nr:polyphosphate kinase 2 [Gammaproteobacteria bacterium]